MTVKIHPHTKERMLERGATEKEIIETVKKGESFPTKYGRIGFRHNFSFQSKWRKTFYNTIQNKLMHLPLKKIMIG